MFLIEYLDPVSIERPDEELLKDDDVFCKTISINTPDHPIQTLDGFQAVIVGIPEERGSLVMGCSLAPDIIRAELYQLKRTSPKLKIADLGNIKRGKTHTDTLYALRDIILELRSLNIVAILLGGSQDLTVGAIMAFENLKFDYTLTTLDYRIDFYPATFEYIRSKNYLNHIILNNKCLFEYINIGQQTCHVSVSDKELFEKLFYECIRMGNLRDNIEMVEPRLRDSDMVSIDFGVLKNADAPGQSIVNPNGLNAEEVCQIAYYAGFGEKTSVFGLFEICPELDFRDATSKLAAQCVWYFLDGLSLRPEEYPDKHPEEFLRYYVNIADDQHINFYKSQQSFRWWFDVPNEKLKSSKVFACSEDDYETTLKGDIPDRWLKLYKKMS